MGKRLREPKNNECAASSESAPTMWERGVVRNAGRREFDMRVCLGDKDNLRQGGQGGKDYQALGNKWQRTPPMCNTLGGHRTSL